MTISRRLWKKTKIENIDAGNLANTQMSAYNGVEEAEVVAICDIDKSKAERLAAKITVQNAEG